MDDESFFSEIWDWVSTSGLRVLIILVAVHFGMSFVLKIVARGIKRGIKPDSFASHNDEIQREDTLISITTNVLRVVIWIVVGMIILSEFGVNIGPLIAGAGIVGLAVGFGAQSLVADFISGLFIIMENQYRVGDVIETNGVSGKVESISLRVTVLRDLDGNQHYIPNGEVRLSTNKSFEFSNINLDIGVGYGEDLDQVEKVINEVCGQLAEHSDFKDYIIEAPKFLRVSNLGDSAVEIKITGKVEPGKQWMISGELRKRIKKSFDKEGIEIPFPQRVIHTKKS